MRLTVNDAEVEVDDRHTATPLLWVLRDVLGLSGPKFGCGAGYCASCTVLVDGQNVKSCQMAAGRAVGRAVETVEGVSGSVADAVRDAWYRGNVVQCGYCQPGQTLAAMALLGKDPAPDDATIKRWMNGNLCRCGTYPQILHAIQEAASTLAAGERPPRLPEHPAHPGHFLSGASAREPGGIEPPPGCRSGRPAVGRGGRSVMSTEQRTNPPLTSPRQCRTSSRPFTPFSTRVRRARPCGPAPPDALGDP